MKFTKKCGNTYKIRQKKNKLDRRCPSAGMFYTSSAGAVTSLIFKRNVPNSIILITIILISALITNFTYATTSTLTISVIDSISLSIIPNGSTGTFATSDTSTNNISVSTNNGTGYELGIKASSEGSNALINSSDSTKTIPSHTVAAGIDETTYRNSSTYNNTWGYRPSKLNSVANSNYLPGPTSASTITTLDKTSTANPSTANTYNLSLGVRVNNNTVSGTYSNTFIVTVVANPALYSITYNKNTTDTVTNMPDNIINGQASGDTVQISSTTPTRNGYDFQGWCTTQVADGADCTGTSYSAGGNWTIDQTASSNSLSLYARWKVSKIYIQDLTLSQCQVNVGTGGNPANIGDNITVYDKRDENDYTVRYINGLCWMTQNLRFQGNSVDTTNTNTDTNKNIAWYDLAGNEGSQESGHCYGALRLSPFGWYGNGFSYACKHDSGNTSKGVWYNYAGATAMTITGVSSSTKASYDICPKNWHLPTGPSTTSNTESNKLVGNTTSGMQNPTTGLTAFGAVTGGYYDGGSLKSTGVGYWWSSISYDATSRYNTVSYNSDIGQFAGSFSALRFQGVFIRCVRSS